LFLSNADWLLIREWRVAGLPLRVVLRGIADALDAHAHSWGRDRKVGSLRYCAAEVEVARERWERALAGAEAEGDVEPTLDRLEIVLATAHELGVEGGAAVERLRNELKERRRTAFATPREWEAWLAASERALLEALEREDGPETVALLEAEIDAELAPYRQRMPERVARQIRQDAVSRRLLEAHGLMRFTLFQA
jgi:hypothetical protein